MAEKIKEFLCLHEYKIILFLGFVLVAILSFEAGVLKGRQIQEKPIIIEKPALAASGDNQAQNPAQASNLASEALRTPDAETKQVQNCVFVGSKNSNKYHLPSCQFAKRIKPENIVCFKDIQEAVGKGYQPDKGCIK